MQKNKKTGGWQTTLQIEQGSSKLTVKMPFHNKSTSGASGDNLDVSQEKKKKAKKKVQKTQRFQILNSLPFVKKLRKNIRKKKTMTLR